MQVFVLLFNSGTDNEGIYALKLGEQNVVLLFESEDDATRYALLLEAQDFATPSVEPIEQEEVEEFCQQVGYECQLVPEGFVPETEAERLLIVPPENNVEQTDWSLEPPAATPNAETDAELEQMRRRLERMFSKDDE